MKKLIKAQINEKDIITDITSGVHQSFQVIFVHSIPKENRSCKECGKLTKENICKSHYYHNMADFLNDREILEGMIK